MNKAVIFDLDGTLIDSLPDIEHNLNTALEKFGYPKREYKEIMQFIGNGARRLVKDSMGDGVSEREAEECFQYYNELYTKSGSPKTKLFDGVKEMLKALKEQGFKLAILTNKPQLTTDNVYQNYLKQFEFDLVVGQSTKFKCKPDKEGAEHILKTLDVLPKNCYFIGDGETDVLTAVNAGVKGIAVLWGYRSKAQLALAGANLFAEKPQDIFNFVNQ